MSKPAISACQLGAIKLRRFSSSQELIDQLFLGLISGLMRLGVVRVSELYQGLRLGHTEPSRPVAPKKRMTPSTTEGSLI